MSVVSILRLIPRDGTGPQLERAFEELEIFEHSRRSGGFLGGRLLRPLSGQGPYVVVAEWEDAAAYHGWLDNPVRDQIGARLEPLLGDDVSSGELYEDAR
jgi:heme-degrading monooxygenase HmoA